MAKFTSKKQREQATRRRQATTSASTNSGDADSIINTSAETGEDASQRASTSAMSMPNINVIEDGTIPSTSGTSAVTGHNDAMNVSAENSSAETGDSALEEPTSTRTPRGRPKNNAKTTRLHTPQEFDSSFAARRISMNERKREEFNTKFEILVKEYSSCEKRHTAQGVVDAQAYMNAYAYSKENNKERIFIKDVPKLNKQQGVKCHKKPEGPHCGSKEANHLVPYYDSGLLGEEFCDNCDQALLKGEKKRMKGIKTFCCNNGETITPKTRELLSQLRNPPSALKNLATNNDKQLKEGLLNNSLLINSEFAFASVGRENAPDSLKGGRKDCVKVNGEFSFNFSDIAVPKGRKPMFAQTYILKPEDAEKVRYEHISNKFSGNIRREIIHELEIILRSNPLGRTFQTTGDKIRELKQARGEEEIPEISIVLLTSQELKDDAIRNKPGCTVIDIERTDAPTAKQVAVIWVNEDGEAPNVQGYTLSDKAGRMHPIKHYNSILDPACFPLLFPRGTHGWYPGLKKKKYFESAVTGHNRIDREIQEMEENLAENNDDEMDLPTTSVNTRMEEFEDNIADLEDELDEPVTNTDKSTTDIGLTFETNDTALFKKKLGPCETISERQFNRMRIGWDRFDIFYTRQASKNIVKRKKKEDQFHWLWTFRKLAELFLISSIQPD